MITDITIENSERLSHSHCPQNAKTQISQGLATGVGKELQNLPYFFGMAWLGPGPCPWRLGSGV